VVERDGPAGNSTDNPRSTSVNGLTPPRKRSARPRGAAFLISRSLFWEGPGGGGGGGGEPSRARSLRFHEVAESWDNPSGEIPGESKRIPRRSPGVFGISGRIEDYTVGTGFSRTSGRYLKKRKGRKEITRVLYREVSAARTNFYILAFTCPPLPPSVSLARMDHALRIDRTTYVIS